MENQAKSIMIIIIRMQPKKCGETMPVASNKKSVELSYKKATVQTNNNGIILSSSLAGSRTAKKMERLS